MRYFLITFLVIFTIISCDDGTSDTNDSDQITEDKDTIIIDEDSDESVLDEDTVTDEDDADVIEEDEDTVTPDEDEIIPDEDENVPDEDEVIPDTLSVRAVAANVTSGNGQDYDEGHGIRILQGLKGDIVMVQEFNYKQNTAANYREMVDKVCGTECSYSAGTGQIPNGIISKWPITSKGKWDDPNINNRDLDWAVIDIPGPRDILAISVHLHTSPSSDQVTAAQVIAKQVYTKMKSDPDKYYYIVGGDFNGPSAVSDSGFGKYSGTKIFYVSGPHPESEDGDYGTNASRSKQYDFVLADYDLHTFQTTVKYTNFSYPNGLVFDTREYSQSELNASFSPAQKGDSDSTNMQHMAIVKDFVIDLK